MSFPSLLKELVTDAKREPLTLKQRETLYSSAYGMYQVGDYVQAADLFTLLTLNEPYELRFWKGLASCRQMQREYKAALHAWGIVCLLGGHSPISHFHAAECYLSMGEIKEAAKALECAEFHLKSKKEPLSEKIEELKRICHGAN